MVTDNKMWGMITAAAGSEPVVARPLSKIDASHFCESASVFKLPPYVMLEVFFTVDVEVWCDGWDSLDSKFPAAFDRYVYGPQRQGGLPTQLKALNDHGLTGVCFVEPLFAGRFGLSRLTEIVG